MPIVRSRGVDLHHVERGEGEETVVFSHSYLVDHRHFEAQIEALSSRYRVIAYDHRDHGQSSRVSEPYVFEDLVQDAVAVIEQTGAAPCHWIGLSTGGFVGARLLYRYPELLRSMTLMDTSVGDEPLKKRLKYKAMLAALRLAGIKPLMGATMGLMFGRSSAADPGKAEMLALWRARIMENDPAALIRFGRAIWSRDDVTEQLADVKLPTLCVSGAEDRAIPPSVARANATAIPGAKLELIPAAGHLCTLEQPEKVSEVLAAFLASVG